MVEVITRNSQAVKWKEKVKYYFIMYTVYEHKDNIHSSRKVAVLFKIMYRSGKILRERNRNDFRFKDTFIFIEKS